MYYVAETPAGFRLYREFHRLTTSDPASDAVRDMLARPKGDDPDYRTLWPAGTLRTELDRFGPMPPALAADWFGQVLEGLASAHAAGLVHRDLKPENVMGARTNGQLDVKLLDLGLVKVRTDQAGLTATMTAEGVVMGTLGYMAPEQLLGREVDERADIYSFGIMTFEALTGQRPLGDGRDNVYRLRGSDPTTIALDGLLQRCLVADPRHRLASAAALSAELIPLLRACDPARLAT